MSTQPRSIAELRKAAALRMQAKQATTSQKAVPEKDPNECGDVAIPNHPDGDDKKKLGIPEGEPTTATSVPDGVTTETKPGGALEGDTPATRDGNARDDAFTSPTTPLSKIAKSGNLSEKAAAALSRLADVSARYKTEAAPTPTKAASATPAPAPAAPAPQKKATAEDLEGADSAIMKLAHFLATTEGGIERVERMYQEEAGVKIASELLAGARQERDAYYQLMAGAEQEELQKQAALLEEMHQADAYLSNLDDAQLQKVASNTQFFFDQLQKLDAMNPHLPDAYVEGYKQAARVVQAMAAGEEMPEVPGAEGELQPEQLIELITAAAQSGELDPQVAEELLAALQAGGGEEMPPEAAAGGGEEMPPEAMGGGEEEMPKAATLSWLAKG